MRLEKTVVRVTPTRRSLLILMSKSDMEGYAVRNSVHLCEKLCMDAYPELFRGVIYHLNNQLRRLVSTEDESIPSVCTVFDRWLRPAVRANELAMVMWDPRDPGLIPYFQELKKEEE